MTGDGAASRLPTPVEVVHRPRSRNHSPPLPASRRLAPSVAIGLGLRMLAAGPAHFLTVLLAEAAMSAARELNKPGSCDARHGCRVAGIPAVPCSLAQLRNTRSRVDAASASSSSGEERAEPRVASAQRASPRDVAGPASHVPRFSVPVRREFRNARIRASSESGHAPTGGRGLEIGKYQSRALTSAEASAPARYFAPRLPQ